MPAPTTYATGSPTAFLAPLTQAFLGPEIKRQHDILQDLLRKNSALGGHPNGYYHAGQLFALVAPKFLRGSMIGPIHPTLQDSADHLMFLRDRLQADNKRLTQSLTVILSRCQSTQDIRDAFPEALVEEVSDLRSLSRTRPEGFLLEANPLLHDQYQKAIDIALDYKAKRLIY